MKKLYLSLALILCLALCVFSFASCKKDNDETTATDTEPVTTAEATTAAPTEHVHVAEDEYTTLTPPSCTEPGSKAYYCTVCRELIPGTTVDIPATGHVPATEYTVDLEETCTTAGSKSYHCTVCQKIVESTVVPIPSDPDKHVVEWTVKEPHLLDQNGHKSGECSLCHTPLEEDIAWEPTIFNSKTAEKVSNGDPNFGTGSYYLSKEVQEILGDKHFYPTDDNPDGYDLWFEYSLLWNETLANYDGRLYDPVKRKFDDDQQSVIALISFRKKNGDQGTFKDLYRIYTRDNASVDCPYAGSINMTTFRPLLDPAYSCVYDLGAGKPFYKATLDDPVTAASFPALGGYGWHRIGFRFHQEVVIDNEHPYQKLTASNRSAAIPSAYSELYIDGVLVWKVETSMQGNWDDANGEWAERNHGLRINGLSLYNYKVDASDPTQLAYSDNTALIVEMKLQNVFDCANAVIVVTDDAHWTCGTGFVRNVEPDPSPVATNIEIADGVTVPGTVYFKLAD